MASREISRTDGTDINLVNRGVKNKFKWTWLEETDLNCMFLSDWVRKVNLSGRVMWILHNDLVTYESGGKKDLKRHANKKKNTDVIKLRKTNTTLSSSYTLSD